MTFDRLSRRTLAALSAVVAAPLAFFVLPMPTAAAQPCPDVEVVFARGTSEPAGVGRVGQALADALRPQLGGRTVGTYGVNYPASYDFLNTAAGATDAANRVAFMSQQCPGTRIVLGGYSQGAAVIDMLAGVPPLGNKVGNIGSAPPLPGSLNGNVAAVAVFGNPATKFGNPVSAAGSFAGKAIDLCANGDPICSDGRNPFAHTSYESSPFIAQAAGFAAGRI
ncbi:putative cutinase cut3 [Mycolicibacterium vanbaalenii]|uniref:Cutinase n=2 Tax=Mycolicibacterium vanbaalenii TaxID=110539 RepID=A0A5S9QJ75_MYCVN|nr:putative cutinase cut3 [Mycolicibacterium vanbaalenii]